MTLATSLGFLRANVDLAEYHGEVGPEFRHWLERRQLLPAQLLDS